MKQRNEFLELLHKFKELFNGTLGTWKIDPEDFKLKDNVKPICLQQYPVPEVHKEMFKNGVECLVLLRVLKVENDSEWGALSFAQPKPKLNRVLFLSDFRNLNK